MPSRAQTARLSKPRDPQQWPSWSGAGTWVMQSMPTRHPHGHPVKVGMLWRSPPVTFEAPRFAAGGFRRSGSTGITQLGQLGLGIDCGLGGLAGLAAGLGTFECQPGEVGLAETGGANRVTVGGVEELLVVGPAGRGGARRTVSRCWPSSCDWLAVRRGGALMQAACVRIPFGNTNAEQRQTCPIGLCRARLP